MTELTVVVGSNRGVTVTAKEDHFIVRKMKDAMQRKLDERATRYPQKEGGIDYWTKMPLEMLLDHLDEQVDDLRLVARKIARCGLSGPGIGKMLVEMAGASASVANLAAMVADRTGALGRPPVEEDVFCTHIAVGGFGEDGSSYICKNCGVEDIDAGIIRFLRSMDLVEEDRAHEYKPVRNKKGTIIGLVRKTEDDT